MADTFGGTSVGTQVAHDVPLGDRASYSMEGVLTARAGKALVTITLPMRPGAEAQALAIGRKLFERLARRPSQSGRLPRNACPRAGATDRR